MGTNKTDSITYLDNSCNGDSYTMLRAAIIKQAVEDAETAKANIATYKPYIDDKNADIASNARREIKENEEVLKEIKNWTKSKWFNTLAGSASESVVKEFNKIFKS
jgi:hypothetical protein